MSSEEMERLSRSLLDLRTLLSKYDFAEQAATVEEIALISESDPQMFFHRLNGAAVWGASGSVWDVRFLMSETDPREVKEDERRLLRLLLDVAEAVSKLYDSEGDAAEAAKTLRYWQSEGVF